MRNRLQSLTLILLVATVLPLRVLAQDPGLTLPEQADVRIVVDMSGSMKETDPDNLRRPAVRLLARMLPEQASSGLWTFGQYVNMLVPHGPVDDAWRETMIERSERINSVALHTNLGLAIEKASDDWLTNGTLENTHLIVLSDGKVDIPEGDAADQAEADRILQELAPRLAEQGATIHTVGLSELADIEFLRELARQTGGSFRLAQSAEALNLAFANALNSAVPQEQIPIENDGFSVDEGVEEFTALIFSGKPAGQESGLRLAAPDSDPFSANNTPENVRWAAEPGYDLITVTDPQAGDWRLLGELGQGSRITVVSDMRMAVADIPAEFSEEDPFKIEVAFYEESEKLQSQDFLGLMEVTLAITSSDGRKGNKVLSPETPPEDGVYRDQVGKLPKPGQYEIEVIAEAETFSRKFSATTNFVVPGEESPVPVVSEPLVPDLSQQVDSPALVGEPETAPEPEPEAQPEPEVEAQPEPEPEPAPPEPETEAAPEPAAVEEEQSEEPAESGLWGMPLWLIGAGAAVVVGIVALGLFAAYRKKKAQAEAEEAAAAERETVEDLPPETPKEEVPPVVEPEPETEPESEAEVEQSEEMPSEDMPEPETQPETEDVPELEPETPDEEKLFEDESTAEEIPEVTEQPEPEPQTAEAEEDIPVADELVTEEPTQDTEEPPKAEADESAGPEEPETPAEPEEPEQEPAEEEDEFGLEDFDLSEFDDLPDYESEFDKLDADETDPDETGSEKSDKDEKDEDRKK